MQNTFESIISCRYIYRLWIGRNHPHSNDKLKRVNGFRRQKVLLLESSVRVIKVEKIVDRYIDEYNN